VSRGHWFPGLARESRDRKKATPRTAKARCRDIPLAFVVFARHPFNSGIEKNDQNQMDGSLAALFDDG
jgi:hypothetical protein